MAYRTYINDYEWLGNNEFDEDIFEELKRQGCVFDADYCVRGFEIKDLDGLVKATEKRIIRLFNKNNSIADFSDTIKREIALEDKADLTYWLKRHQEYAYIFSSAQLLNYVGKNNYHIEDEITDDWITYKYVLNDGVKCIFEAF